MKGSEKQIEWATSILARWVDSLNKEHDNYMQNSYWSKEWKDCVTATKEKLYQLMIKKDAKWIIDQRKLDFPYYFCGLVTKELTILKNAGIQ